MSTIASIISVQDKAKSLINEAAKGESKDAKETAALAVLAVDLIGGLLLDIKRIADAAELANGGK
jgi:hypothetical protein